MELFLDICQGLGLAAAVGIRPFLPTLLVGAAAGADQGIDLEGTDFYFLETVAWLIPVAVVMVVSFLLRRGWEPGPTDAAVGGVSIGLGALFFAGTLADHGRDSLGWVVLGLVAGGAAALLGNAASRDLATRTSRRLDDAAQRALPVYFEVVALVIAALSILIPPVSLVVLPFLAWLLAGGRRREGGKYAGLRILR